RPKITINILYVTRQPLRINVSHQRPTFQNTPVLKPRPLCVALTTVCRCFLQKLQNGNQPPPLAVLLFLFLQRGEVAWGAGGVRGGQGGVGNSVFLTSCPSIAASRRHAADT
uniref:Uncharacterized protein n=1 Tax=Gasterosteus aculeatus TaxID=69293 RepID=G3N7V8_GASAC